MAEKEQQSTTQPERSQSFPRQTTEDEVHLIDLLEVIIRKKFLIFAITSICTLFSILYAYSITPTYQATISFLEPHETFFAALPTEISEALPGGRKTRWDKKGQKIQSPIIPFSMFLSKVTSYKFNKIVFENGNFLKEFYANSSTTDTDMEIVILGIHNSISISKEKGDTDLPDFERPVSLKMVGAKPEAMSKFLNTLVESAKQAIIKDIKDQAFLIVENEIKKISREIDILRSVAEEKTFKKITVFSEALAMANNLGIKNNNFDKLKSSNVAVGISTKARASLDLRSTALESFLESQEKTTIHVQDTTLPVWFLYGEKALQQELDTIKSRKTEAPIPGMSLKNIALKKYQSIDPSSIIIKVITISQPSIAPATPIKPNKKRLISIGMVVGLVIGIFMAFILNSIDQLRKKQLSTISTGD